MLEALKNFFRRKPVEVPAEPVPQDAAVLAALSHLAEEAQRHRKLAQETDSFAFRDKQNAIADAFEEALRTLGEIA